MKLPKGSIPYTPGMDFRQYAGYDFVTTFERVSIDDHPFAVGEPGQANIRFRQLGEQKKFQRMKRDGIETFLRPVVFLKPR